MMVDSWSTGAGLTSSTKQRRRVNVGGDGDDGAIDANELYYGAGGDEGGSVSVELLMPPPIPPDFPPIPAGAASFQSGSGGSPRDGHLQQPRVHQHRNNNNDGK